MQACLFVFVFWFKTCSPVGVWHSVNGYKRRPHTRTADGGLRQTSLKGTLSRSIRAPRRGRVPVAGDDARTGTAPQSADINKALNCLGLRGLYRRWEDKLVCGAGKPL